MILRLQQQRQYNISSANAMSLTWLVFFWGIATLIAFANPVGFLTGGVTFLFSLLCALYGICMVLYTYADYVRYRALYAISETFEFGKQPLTEDARRAKLISEVERISKLGRKLTEEDGNVYLIFTMSQRRELFRLADALNNKRPDIDECGWVLIGFNERVAEDTRSYYESRGRYNHGLQPI